MNEAKNLTSNISSDSTAQQENKKNEHKNKKSIYISSLDFKKEGRKEGDISSKFVKGTCGFEVCWGLLFCSCL